MLIRIDYIDPKTETHETLTKDFPEDNCAPYANPLQQAYDYAYSWLADKGVFSVVEVDSMGRMRGHTYHHYDDYNKVGK